VGDGAGELDARGSRADEDHREQVTVLRRVLLGLRGLVGPEQLGPDRLRVGERLEPGSESRELVVTEVTLLDPRGQDEVVVRNGRGAALGRPCQDVTALQVDTGHLGHDDGGVALLAHHLADRNGDVLGRQRRGRYLVQQWLENMMIAAVDQEDTCGSAAQGLDRGKTREAATDHYHTCSVVHHRGVPSTICARGPD
jgi:hypothetical protein